MTTATRRKRRLWPAAAALVMVLVGLAVAAGMGAFDETRRTAAGIGGYRPANPAQDVLSIQYNTAPQDWLVLAKVERQSTTEVHIRIEVELAEGSYAATMVGLKVELALGQSLDGRVVIDDSTGMPVPLLTR